MAAGIKTDNHAPGAKLDLRRYFLETYHRSAPPRVIDCCAGGGVLWRQLRKEFAVANYWPLDVKPKKGRLKIDSVRVLAQPGWRADIVDVDTYGVPWKHWAEIIRHGPTPLTVFLTIGSLNVAGGSVLSHQEADALGLSFERLKVPASFTSKLLRQLAAPYCLAECEVHGKRIVEATEAESDGNARYLAIRLDAA